MEIPYHLAKDIQRHYRRIAGNARCDPADTRTADTMRLAQSDLRKLDGLIRKEDAARQQHTPHNTTKKQR